MVGGGAYVTLTLVPMHKYEATKNTNKQTGSLAARDRPRRRHPTKDMADAATKHVAASYQVIHGDQHNLDLKQPIRHPLHTSKAEQSRGTVHAA